MKKYAGILFTITALLAALSAVIISLALFRYEIEEFVGSIGEKISNLGSNKHASDDEYADFDDM